MAYQAIETRYYGPGNVRGSLVRAKAAAGTVWVEYDPGLSTQANHTAAAEKLARKFDWRGDWYAGTLASGDNVFVNVAFNERRPHDPDAAFRA